MQNRIFILFIIIVLLTISLGILKSRKRLWTNENTLNSRMSTVRALILLGLIVLFLFFSLVR